MKSAVVVFLILPRHLWDWAAGRRRAASSFVVSVLYHRGSWI